VNCVVVSQEGDSNTYRWSVCGDVLKLTRMETTYPPNNGILEAVFQRDASPRRSAVQPHVDAMWKRQTAADRSSYGGIIARRAVCATDAQIDRSRC